MGTRGALGFFKNAEHKVTYNHFDSYPEGLGLQVLEFCKKHSVSQMNKMFKEIELVDRNSKPTKEQRAKIPDEAIDLAVSEQSEDDWYCLLRNAQGDLEAYGEIGFMIDNHNFLYDSVFCEWAYIINLDEEMLEIYKGFQNKKPAGRYSHIKPDENGYYAVSLVMEYALESLPENAKFLKDLIKEEEEE